MKSSTKSILIPVDFSDQSLIALEQSFNLSRMLHAELCLLFVIEEQGGVGKLFGKQEDDAFTESINVKLKELADKVASEQKLKVKAMVVSGKVYEQIVETADHLNPLMIIMGCNGGTGLKRRFIGSNALRVVREANCPVITIKGKHHRQGCENIVLPLDLSKETKDKVSKGIELARLYGAEIRVVSVVFTPDEFTVNKLTRQLANVKQQVEESGISCSAEIVKSIKGNESLAEIIIDYTHKVDGDLIMIMTQQEVDFTQYFIGSSAQEIINLSDIPVLSIVPVDRTEGKKVTKLKK
jgi:nucleotide-binding universal stress UspA family protein